MNKNGMIVQAVMWFEERTERGEQISVDAFVAEYPQDIRNELRSFLIYHLAVERRLAAMNGGDDTTQ